MARPITLGNGEILVCIDEFGQVHDFYFPFVGTENHIGGRSVHKIGIWAEGKFSWLEDGRWRFNIDYAHETMASDITATNNEFGVELKFTDVVYNESNIFIRKIEVRNLLDKKQEIRLFINQQFNIAESKRGDTAYYNPEIPAIVHYEGRRVFAVGGINKIPSFDSYSTGQKEEEGKEGTWRDAEDGVLSKNPIEFGSVDSVVSFNLNIDAGEEEKVYYWISAGETLKQAKILHHYVIQKSPEYLIKTTKDYWHAWVNKNSFDFPISDDDISKLFKKSLIIIRSHMGDNGSIIASADSKMLQYHRDTYSYVWPRDAAFIVMAMDRAGYTETTKNFFVFCNDVLSSEGYLYHKYRADKSIGSSWHPWVKNDKRQLPIQEDETALVLCALWNHYVGHKNLEFIEKIYNSLIKKSADFLASYRDETTRLPKGSYNLWEEGFGTHTFTTATVYGALKSAANFAEILGKKKDEAKYSVIAEEIKKGMLKHLVNDENGFFYNTIDLTGDEILHDKTIDISSFYGVFKFFDIDANDELIKKAADVVKERLYHKSPIGGVVRYEGDKYYGVDNSFPGNPWIITTMWLANYYIDKARERKDLEIVEQQLRWVIDRAFPSGVLPEQINPYTGEPLSATPLVWSHAEFVNTVINYLEKLKHFNQ